VSRVLRPDFTPWLRALLVLALFPVSLAPAHAQPQPSPVKRAADASGPSWQSLTHEQRTTLAPLQNDWASIDAPRKAKWLNIASRYPKLPSSEQKLLQTRMTEWSRLAPSERARARVTFQEAKQLPNQERQDKWQAYQALPESQRQALATRGTSAAAKAPEHAAKPPPELSVKRNIVGNPSLSAGPSRPVAPTVVQAPAGATTNLMTRQPAPPAHQQAGLPKIAATPGFVDRNTLLPRRGAQSAGVRGSASSSPPQPGHDR
jgi:hypothetical protein